MYIHCQEGQNGAAFGFLAPSSEELHVLYGLLKEIYQRQLTFGLFFTVERLRVKVAAFGLGADGGLGTGFDILSTGVCGVDTLSSGVCGLDTGNA